MNVATFRNNQAPAPRGRPSGSHSAHALTSSPVTRQRRSPVAADTSTSNPNSDGPSAASSDDRQFRSSACHSRDFASYSATDHVTHDLASALIRAFLPGIDAKRFDPTLIVHTRNIECVWIAACSPLRCSDHGQTDAGSTGPIQRWGGINVVDCSIDRTANLANGGFAFAPDDRPAEVINKPFRRVDREHSHGELSVRLDERQRERERVARELHDSLLQGFLGVSLQLQAAVGQVPASLPSKAALDHTMVRMQDVINEARHVLLGLRSSAMESMSLEQALSSLRDEFAPDGGVEFRVCVTGQPKSLRPAIQEQIYLIVREALINAFRHSEATSIEAEVEYRPRWLRILVRDNGRGIDPATVRSGRHAHWGLAGMRERAAGIGAELRIWSRLGAGTEVEIWVQAGDWEKPCLTRRSKCKEGSVRASRRQANVAGRVPNSAYASGTEL